MGEAERKKTAKREAKQKLTDQVRHERFVEMAHQVEADETPEAFERAFDAIAKRTAWSKT